MDPLGLAVALLPASLGVGTLAHVPCVSGNPIWGFPKIRGTLLGVLIIRIIVFWGLHWGPLILGNYHMSFCLTNTTGLPRTEKGGHRGPFGRLVYSLWMNSRIRIHAPLCHEVCGKII